ncbi:MAG: hypothetical protein ABMA64_38620 [Myxococcota bacterium]
MNPTLALFSLSLMAPGVALAHDHDDHHDTYDHHDNGPRYSTLSIRNEFDGEADVYVDHRLMGRIGGDRTLSWQVVPGSHDVTVLRPATGYVLVQSRIRLYDGSAFVLPVKAPTSALRVSNDGDVLLKVQADDAMVWLSPGTSAQLPVETGFVTLAGSIKEPRGEWKAMEKTVWVEPGTVGSETLRPDPTVIVVTNRDRMAVRALVDGVDAGFVGANSTRRIWVRPGTTAVVLLDPSGRVRTSTTVYVSRGKEVKLVVEPWYAPAVVSASVHVDIDRPGGPVRPQHQHDGTCHH